MSIKAIHQELVSGTGDNASACIATMGRISEEPIANCDVPGSLEVFQGLPERDQEKEDENYMDLHTSLRFLL